MTDRFQTRLITGGHQGTEAEFGHCAKRWGIPETTISYEGHEMARSGEVEVLSDADLARGDVSMEIVFARLGRTFSRGKGIRRVIQSIFHIVDAPFRCRLDPTRRQREGGYRLGRRAREVLPSPPDCLRSGEGELVRMGRRIVAGERTDHSRCRVLGDGDTHADGCRKSRDPRAVRAVLRRAARVGGPATDQTPTPSRPRTLQTRSARSPRAKRRSRSPSLGPAVR